MSHIHDLADQCSSLRGQLRSAQREIENWKRAAESQNKEWVAKCEEATELKAVIEDALNVIESITKDPKPEHLALGIFAKLRHLQLKLATVRTGQPYGIEPAKPEAGA